MICIRRESCRCMSSMCLFLMCTSAFASRSSRHLLHSLVSLSVGSASFHTSALWQVQALIIYCRMTFDLSRWPRARGHKWGPRVTDAITAHPGTNPHRRCLTLPLLECMKQIKERGVFSRMWGEYASFHFRARQLRVSLPFPLSLCTHWKHNCTNKSLSQQHGKDK